MNIKNIAIIAHVDHGKTTLVDQLLRQAGTFRENEAVAERVMDSNDLERERGITILAKNTAIDYKDYRINILDTPGHAAFTEMRARGASVTDIVIIIVSAEDGVMPQTKEAVDHALAANVPIIVAINKIDKPNANPDRIMTEMVEINITPEEWGGTIPFVRISAKSGEGIDKLLETILAIAEVSELKANPNRYATGTVIESRIDKNMGGVASILIQNGTLRLGDPIVVGVAHGRVRTLKDDLGRDIVEAGPSTPVEITGLSDNPSAGDKFMAFESEHEARDIAGKRAIQAKENKNKKQALSLDELLSNSDIITVNIPLNEENKNLISKDKIGLMKKTATFINTSRAEIVDMNELMRYADENATFNVGLDIDAENYKEILNVKRNNVIVTPHIAGVTKEAIKRMDVELANSIKEYLEEC